jgi:adenine-specific DNA-methyltransferase
MTKQKLELTWIGKEKRPKLEPRILLEDPEKSYHAQHRVSDNDIFDNRLIFGDNLLALKALEQEFAGKVKCIFIDPPYNTGSAFTHYDDGLEHSIWLGLMRDRLEIIKRLLSDDGSLWITIDDNEAHYLKVLCDEVLGRSNYITSAIWQKTMSVKNSTRHFSIDHDYVLVYARDAARWTPNQVAASDKQHASYKNPDDDPRGPWQSISLSARNPYSKGLYGIRTPGGRFIEGPPAGSYWRVSEEKFWELDSKGEIWWGKDRNGMPRRKMYLADQGELTKAPHLEIATNPGDLILDSFAGSGTTGAVAHKMGRRWIMVELGEHCHTHIIPRLKRSSTGRTRWRHRDSGLAGGGASATTSSPQPDRERPLG